MTINSKARQHLGAWGEEIAAAYLKNLGYQIIASNYRTRYGELDLICRDGGVWCFIEVKTRKNRRFGYGYQAVTLKKQRHMMLAAQIYLSQARLMEVPVRFDIVSIDFKTAADYQISLINNAFTVTGE